MPDHIRYLLKHAGLGVVAAIVFAGALFWLNVANLQHLVLSTADGPLAFGVMTVLFAITFGSVQMGISIMALADDDGGRGGKRSAIATNAAVAASAQPLPVTGPQRASAITGKHHPQT